MTKIYEEKTGPIYLETGISIERKPLAAGFNKSKQTG